MIHVYTVRNVYPCRSVVNCSSEMVLSIDTVLLKKKSGRIEYPAIRATSFVSIVVYLQREQRGFFYISHYSVTEINPFHDGSVAENTTEQVNWYFSSMVVSSWKGLTFIIRVFFPRYSVEIIVKEINVWWTWYSVEIIVEKINILAISWNIFLKGLICITLIFIWNT